MNSECQFEHHLADCYLLISAADILANFVRILPHQAVD
jgi:hypothetical protein